ncbi:MAG: CofH family radical SAM protein [Planctomycetota bacterium]
MDDALTPIIEKLDSGQRLDANDGLTLLQTPDVFTLGELASRVRHERHGKATYYNVNRHCNYSNLCILSCKFCEFHRKPNEDGAYLYTVDQVVEQAHQAVAAGATEMHIVGGLHPKLPFDYYTDLLSALRDECPRLHIKAFTAVELVHLTRKAKLHKDPDGIRITLQRLIDAGLGSLPGGGAEVFDDRVHDEAFRGKISGREWIEVHRTAHALGLMSNATMLYGHLEALPERVNHFLTLRDAQDEAINNNHKGRFQTIIPLPFFPDGSALQHLPGPTGLDNLRMLATARLMLDNFDHVKCFWIMQTLPMAGVSLDFGVDDVDGTVVWYDITKVGGADNHQEVTVTDLRRTITDAGYTPVERDTLYRPVIRNGADWHVEAEEPAPPATSAA